MIISEEQKLADVETFFTTAAPSHLPSVGCVCLKCNCLEDCAWSGKLSPYWIRTQCGFNILMDIYNNSALWVAGRSWEEVLSWVIIVIIYNDLDGGEGIYVLLEGYHLKLKRSFSKETQTEWDEQKPVLVLILCC